MLSGELDAVVTEPYRTPRRRLPVLEDLRVASPCDVSWDEMVGNGRARHCAKCAKQVFNISAMKRADAELFLLEHVDGECVRFFRRHDGTLLTADCPVGVRMRHRARVFAALLTTTFFGLLALIGVVKPCLVTKVSTAVQGGSTTQGFAP